MKNFLLKLIFLSVFAFLFAIETNAQLCGRYSTFISVSNTEGKPIKNAEIELTAIEKDRTNGEKFVRRENPSEFSITFNEGHMVSGTYKITVSAKGYKTHEFETRFPHCQRRNFILKLAKSNSDAVNNFEEIREINFRAIDENKKGIAKVKTIVSWENGKVLEMISNDGGQTDFKVFNNKILKVRFEKEGYKTKEIEINLSESNLKYLDVKLEKVEP